ncbi:helix-turn-helix domain-containing protein [Novosphingobium sp. AAP93]|uniref:helix-turn-helix domain-containing protein n=1 Tax=Novosphingobium sp. AAP93 TaxID=1523427 RepID=UPI0006B9B7F8|nr:helix-turn-helix domain-containing protein [Novosphingobium sp. AAP93]KPF82083.1 AraC family transcriptional regulator [Novosphingobium sp. AAP93]
MNRMSRPAIDPAIASGGAATRDGQPISYSRAPARDLAPWIARLYVTIVDAPEDYALSCGIFSDAAMLRIQLRGEWTAETAEGRREMGRAALYFGPQTRRMPITVKGSFTSVGLSFRPGACHALGKLKLDTMCDKLAPLETLGMCREEWMALFDESASAEDWCLAMEEAMRRLVRRSGAVEPDPVTVAVEAAAFTNPEITVARLAEQCGAEQRRLERLVRRDFGIPPKQVLRRARALDMASHLRGVADHNEAEALALRYYDQSHLIREFTALFGMSPRQFVDSPQPLMTLSLETRQARRLETTARIAPGDIKPWQ